MPLLKKETCRKGSNFQWMTLKQRPNLPETLWTKKKTHGPEQRPSGLNQRPSNTTPTHTPPP